jgi:hypothetical protein
LESTPKTWSVPFYVTSEFSIGAECASLTILEGIAYLSWFRGSQKKMTMVFSFLGRGDLGLIHAGMSREESRKALGGRFEAFYKAEDSTVPTDAYDDLGVHVYFDERYRVFGVEFLKWSGLVWDNQKLVGEDALVVRQFLAKRGEVLVFNNSGFSVTGVGLRFYVPDFEEGDAIVEAVYVELSV